MKAYIQKSLLQLAQDITSIKLGCSRNLLLLFLFILSLVQVLVLLHGEPQKLTQTIIIWQEKSLGFQLHKFSNQSLVSLQTGLYQQRERGKRFKNESYHLLGAALTFSSWRCAWNCARRKAVPRNKKNNDNNVLHPTKDGTDLEHIEYLPFL